MSDPTLSHPLTGEPPREPLRILVAIFAGYLFLAVIFTWPLLLHLGDGVIQKGGLPVDAGQGVWNLWWARSAVLAAQNPFPTHYLFYPLELNLFYQTLSLPNALLAAPVLLFAGPVAAFNTVALLSFALGGLWMYQLAGVLVKDRWAALIAGAVFVFTPYHIQRLWSGPMELIAIHWLPLYLLALMRALHRRTVAAVLLAALALLVTTLSSQYYGLYAAVFTALYVLLAALLAPRDRRWRTFFSGAAVGLFWVALLLPFVLVTGGLGDVVLEDWYERQVYHSVALIDLITPNIQHPLWGGAAAAWQGRLHPFGLEAGAAPGFVVYGLCLVALLRDWRRAWPWFVLALGSLLFAMGPQLRVTEAFSPVPGPFLLLDSFGPFRNSSRPGVFIVLTILATAVLSALGVAGLRAFFAAQRRMLVALACSLLLLSELMVAPWPITPLQAAVYTVQLNRDSVPGAVLHLPPRNNDSISLINQICHGRPMLGGYLARLPPYPPASYPSAVQRLWDAEAPGPDMLDLAPGPQLAALDVRYVVLDLTELPRGQAMRLREQLAAPGISRVFADERAEVYAVDPAAAQPTVLLGAGWYEREQAGERIWRWMGAQAQVQVQMPWSGPVELSFVATAYNQARPLQVWLGSQLLAEFEIPAAPYDRTLTLALVLPPGPTTLTLAGSPGSSPERRALAFSIERLRIRAVTPADSYLPIPAAPPPATIPAVGTAPCK
ncbi:MAG: hypothetical protein HC822_12435 [Oscillochloris sp.]|nr:hypothetical protein [Oscillochloris sp.]